MNYVTLLCHLGLTSMFNKLACSNYASLTTRLSHRDKTRLQMLAKMFPRLKLLYLLFMGPTLGFDTKQRNSFFIKFGVFLQ
jgi:hypothetical protein